METRKNNQAFLLATRTIHEPPLPDIILPKSKAIKKIDDDFYGSWDRFLAKAPNRTSSISTLAKRVAQTEKAAHKDENGLKVKEESSVKSYDQAKAECKAKVRAIVTECRRLNQKYIDRHFDLENEEDDCIYPLGNSSYDDENARPSAVKRIEDIFEKPEFNEDRARAADVIQGRLGDCWLLAALMSIAAKPGLIKRLCVDRDEEVGVYGFVFFRDGAWVPEVIDDRLFLHVSDGEDLFVGKLTDSSRTRAEVSTTTYDMQKLRENLQKGGEALFFARCNGKSDTWLPLIEKAYAKAHGDYGSIEGGDTSEGIEDLTGGVSVSLKPSQILDKKMFWEEMKNANDTYLFAGGAKHYEAGGRSGQHAYAVLQVVEYGDLKLLELRDPWGKKQEDGPWMHKFTEWSSELVNEVGYNFKDPGVFWITYQNFLRHFYIIDRTRLFTPDWNVTLQWASITVPPVPEYLGTSFSLTLSEAGPVVLVLCQPDTRYFRGLEGRYEYSLHFRVYSKDNDGAYLTRSMHGSGCLHRGLRSVTADLQLPAGTYSILVKVTPERFTSRTACGQVVESYTHRKEKLMQAGRNFDLAHAKGKRRDAEKQNRRREKEEARQKKRHTLARARRNRQEGKSRERKRRDRVESERAKRRDAIFWKETAERASRKGVFVPEGVFPMADPDMSPGWETSEIGDDDFEWDSDIDGSASGSETEDEKDLLADDPWNALCVLGLRVYHLHGDAKIRVFEGGTQPDDDDEEDAESKGSDSEEDDSANDENKGKGKGKDGENNEGKKKDGDAKADGSANDEVKDESTNKIKDDDDKKSEERDQVQGNGEQAGSKEDNNPGGAIEIIEIVEVTEVYSSEEETATPTPNTDEARSDSGPETTNEILNDEVTSKEESPASVKVQEEAQGSADDGQKMEDDKGKTETGDKESQEDASGSSGDIQKAEDISK